ncbi:MAG: hypothetical protein V4596_05990 [Bdellovibrionota bacterium]
MKIFSDNQVSSTAKTGKLDSIFSSSDIRMLGRLSTVSNNDRRLDNYWIHRLETVNAMDRVLLDPKPWFKLGHQSVVVSRLEKLIEADPSFLKLIEESGSYVLSYLKLEEGKKGNDQLFSEGKEILLFLSEVAGALDFTKPTIQDDLNRAYGLANALRNESRNFSHPTDRELAILNFFENIKSKKDDLILRETDMKLVLRAQLYYKESSLGQYIERLVDRRQSRKWVSLRDNNSKSLEQRVKDLVINIGWKWSSESNILYAFYKGDHGIGIPVVFSKSSSLQYKDFIPLMQTRDLFGGGFKSLPGNYAYTAIELTLESRFFDLPISVSGVIRHKKGRDAKGRFTSIPYLEIESVGKSAVSTLSAHQAIAEYGKWYQKELIKEMNRKADREKDRESHRLAMIVTEAIIRSMGPPVQARSRTPEDRAVNDFLVEAARKYPAATVDEIADYQARNEAANAERRRAKIESEQQRAEASHSGRESNSNSMYRGVVSDPDVMNAHDAALQRANESNRDMSILDSDID